MCSPCRMQVLPNRHLAHTSWFFETVVLKAFMPGYCVFDERFHFLFNSYYESLGPRHPACRAWLADAARTSGDQGLPSAYRRSHARMFTSSRWTPILLVRRGVADCSRWPQPRAATPGAAVDRHQASPCRANALSPVYAAGMSRRAHDAISLSWVDCSGAAGSKSAMRERSFAFDNETPRPRSPAAPVPVGEPLRELRRRVPGFHRGRRLRAA